MCGNISYQPNMPKLTHYRHHAIGDTREILNDYTHQPRKKETILITAE
jgi:hypothetical protein